MIKTSSRNPFEILLVFAFGLYAMVGFFAFDSVATTTLRTFPSPWGRIFLACATLTCAVVMIGVWRAETPEGVLIERAGLYGLSGITLAYSAWGIGQSGARGLAFAIMLAAMGLSGALRARQITRAYHLARCKTSGV